MLDRCENPESLTFRLYGGRGITVCDAWHSFDSFLADMGVPEKGLSIERIDNEKGYYKENCKWATQKEQVQNQRRVKLTEDDVAKIKSAIQAGRQVAILAMKFNVTKSHIYKIKNGRKWS